MSREEKERLQTSNKDNIHIWETLTRPRVTIGSRSAGSEIWHVESVTFDTDCGLWFTAQFDSKATQQKIETLLRVLGDSGIGGERNAGYGVFDFKTEQVNFEMSIPKGGPAFVTLSPIYPKSPNQLEHLLSGDTIAYDLHTSTDGSIVLEILRPERRSTGLSKALSYTPATDTSVFRRFDAR